MYFLERTLKRTLILHIYMFSYNGFCDMKTKNNFYNFFLRVKISTQTKLQRIMEGSAMIKINDAVTERELAVFSLTHKNRTP